MKKVLAAVCLAVFMFGAAHAEEIYDPQHTMLALNMAIVSVHRILATQDRIILEQEYQNIINNLSLGNIESDKDVNNPTAKVRAFGEVCYVEPYSTGLVYAASIP